MKKFNIILISMLILSVAMVSFTQFKLGGITGKITPPDGAASVALVAGTDTLSADLSQGTFTFTNLKEGVYKLSIRANAPYKDAVIENVAVKDSSTTDLGEIKLMQ